MHNVQGQGQSQSEQGHRQGQQWRIRRGGGNLAMALTQSDSLAINFEFDIRPREVRPSIRCFFVFALNKMLA